MFFPVLVIMAYGADKGWFHGGTKVGTTLATLATTATLDKTALPSTRATPASHPSHLGPYPSCPQVSPESRILDAEHPDWNEEDTRKLIKQYKDAGGTGNVDDPGYKQFVKIMMVKNHKPSRAALRINAIRWVARAEPNDFAR